MRHLIPTIEAFDTQIREQHGEDARLHPSNRSTACGRHGGSLSTTEVIARVTCRVCLKAAS